MSHIEKRKNKYYFVKKISFLNQQKAIKKYIGDIPPNKQKFMLDNLDKISEEELKFKKKFLKLIPCYNKELLEKIELKAITIENIIEAKQCEEIIKTEFATEFIFNSNNIEGSKIPPERVKEILEKGETKYSERNEVREVKNSIEAVNFLENGFKFNISSIKRLYYILTKELYREGNQKYPRGFKKEANIVGNSRTTPPDKVEKELESLLKWYKANKKKIHPLVLAFDFHKKYEQIHPFLDGNGRTGRLIMNKILMSARYFPIIIYKSNKRAYFNAIETENVKKYFQCMLEQTNKTYSNFLEIIKKY